MRKIVFIAVLLIFGFACETVTVSSRDKTSAYGARAAWQWQSLNHFLLRGRARLQGENQVFSGPFLVWVSKEEPAVRADFCGPDGSPIISLLVDESGCLIYHPDLEQASFFAGGIPAGAGYLDVYALISLLRTGYPAIPVQWEIVTSSDTCSTNSVRWLFMASSTDSAVVTLDNSDFFPKFSTEDFTLSVSATSWHEAFRAWPMEWVLNSPSIDAIIRIRSYDIDTYPHESVWNINVPVPVDTITFDQTFWQPSFPLPIR